MYFQGKALLTKRNIFSSETGILDFAKCFFVFHIFRDRHYGRLEQIWRGRRVLRQQSFNTGACSPYLDHGGGGGDGGGGDGGGDRGGGDGGDDGDDEHHHGSGWGMAISWSLNTTFPESE